MKLEHLYKKYRTQDGEVSVLSDFSLDIPTGTIQVLTGPSGCGKTTILHAVSEVIPLDGGQIIREEGEAGQVSYLFQEPRLLPWRNVFSNVELPLCGTIKSKAERADKVLHFLSLVGLDGFASYLPSQLSGGMRQRVAIARAFAFPSTLILMDEPFQSLDIKLRYELLGAFLQLWKEDRRTTLYVTHDVAEAVMAADNVCRLEGPPARIADSFQINVPRNDRKPGLAELLVYEGRLYDGLTS